MTTLTASSNPPSGPPDHERHQRQTPLAARGEPAVWLTGAALGLAIVMIVALIAVVVWRGGATFWPREIQKITLQTGDSFLGIPATEEIDPAGNQRIRFRVGNRDLGQESFRWLPAAEIASIEPAPNAVLIERRAWGTFIGEPRAVLHTERIELAPGEAPEPRHAADGPAPEIEIIEERPDGSRVALFTSTAAAGDALDEELDGLIDEAHARRARIERLNDAELPAIQDRLSALQWKVKAAEREHERTLTGEGQPWPIWGWGLALIGAIGATASALRVRGKSLRASTTRAALWTLAALLTLAVIAEHPLAGPRMSEDRLTSVRERAAERTAELEAERATVLAEIDRLRRVDGAWRLVVIDPSADRFAPRSQSEPTEPMRVSQVERLVRAGDLSFLGKVGVYLGRWGDYLSRPPGEEPGSGGVWPVIVGTVTLTLLLTISVVPLGVIAALYLREYAHQGFVTSAIRVAINNLAGVPSIVYGMFGLGFFCYAVGGYIDGGPGAAALPRTDWWGVLAVAGLALVGGFALWAWSRASSDRGRAKSANLGKWLAVAVWVAAVAFAGHAIATTPYFGGFFAERLPEQPTFGGRGILWASLTLALLTLPVVIVATEEAIAAVPGSMREGSYGCGASRWQTVRKIVLPSALPGIMTGAILAMARGAGEVAPLMLVGAVNLAPALPVTAEPPFLHGDRTFMHLGFHIYNLGFQSPDAEAAEPLVWTTTLLLVGIVLVLNLVAVVIRARLRKGAGAGL